MTKKLPSTCRCTKNEEPAVEQDCTGPLCGSTECGGDHHPLCRKAYLPVPAKGPTHQHYTDNTPNLSVGNSSFESWFSGYDYAHKGDKQRARDAYAAGMGDPLVTAAAPVLAATHGAGTALKLAAVQESLGQPVAWRVHPFDYGIGSKGVYAITQIGLQVEAWERKGWKVEPLYTKGGAA